MKKASIIGLFGLLCVVLLIILQGNMPGSPEVSAYPAPMSGTPMSTLMAKIYLPAMQKNSPHGVGLTSFISDADFVHASWFFVWTIDANLMISYPNRYVPLSASGNISTGYDRLDQLPDGYSGYVILFNEPGGNGSETGSNCILASVAADRYAAAIAAYPNVKFVVGGMFSYDSTSYFSDDGLRENCNSQDLYWRKHFVQALGALDVAPPQYWNLHGYVYPTVEKSDTVEEVLHQWEEGMSTTMTSNIISWFNAASDEVKIDNSYSPKYWITEYNSLHNDANNGPEEFVELMDWIDITIKTGAYPLERAAVFNLRCDPYDTTIDQSWCIGFYETNLLEYQDRNENTKILTERGEHFKGIVDQAIAPVMPSYLLYSSPENETQSLNPYPFEGE